MKNCTYNLETIPGFSSNSFAILSPMAKFDFLKHCSNNGVRKK